MFFSYWKVLISSAVVLLAVLLAEQSEACPIPCLGGGECVYLRGDQSWECLPPPPPPPPATQNKIVYLHGRSQGGWPGAGRLAAPSSWNHVTLSYDGSQRVNNSTVRNTVKNALRENCRGDNWCVVVTHSAGMIRYLRALVDLEAEGTPATNVLWVSSAGSAAGGSGLASYTSKWWKKLIAKIFGLYARIDNDLRPSTMRQSFGYIQNKSPAPVYHLGGYKNICKRFAIFFKLCGNSKLTGPGDGAVAAHSACGFAGTGASNKSHCCASGAKYTNRQPDTCALYPLNHSGIFGKGVENASIRLGWTKYLDTEGTWQVSSGLADAVCTYDDCDADETSVSGSCGTSPSPVLVSPIGGPIAEFDDARYEDCDSGACFTFSNPANGYCGSSTGGGGRGDDGPPTQQR